MAATSDDNMKEKIDQSHILFLHHADHPSYVLSPEPLDGNNYNQWKRACVISLKAKNKLGMVDGKYVRPDSKSPLLAQWERCDNMVISWLIHSMAKDIASSILYCDTAAEIWSELKVRYAHTSGTKIYKIHKEITNFSQGNMSITNYFTKLKYLHDEYTEAIDIPPCTCGSASAFLNLLHNQHLMHFLMGLNDPYNTTRGNLLMKSPLPSVNQAYHALLEEERQREITSNTGISSDSSAMAVYNKKFQQNFNNNNYRWQYTSGQKNNAYKGHNIKMNNYYCDHCKCPGHSTERCYKLNGYPTNHKYNNNNGKGKKMAAYCHNEGMNEDDDRNGGGSSHGQGMINQEQYKHLMDLINKQNLGSDTTPSVDNTPSAMLAGKSLCLLNTSMQHFWILDSGATDHISPHLSSFVNYKRVFGPNNYISTANGHKAEIKHIGEVKLTSNITLSNVLHVPEFHFNLISINKISSDLCCEISFSPTLCVIQGPSMSKPLLLGRHKNGLYYVDSTLVVHDEKQNTKILSPQNSFASHLHSSFSPHVCKNEMDQTKNDVTFVPKNISCNASHDLNEKGDALLWHLRLGHLPFHRFNLIPCVDVCTIKNYHHICHICPKAKQTRKPFPISTIKPLAHLS